MPKPPGILIVCDSYPPRLGGSEIEAQRIAVALIARGHPVRVLCSGGPPMPRAHHWIDPLGVPVSILTNRSRGRAKDVTFALEVGWNLWRRRHEYDLVYFLMQGLHLAVGLPVSRALRKPSVMKISGDGIFSTMSGTTLGRVELGLLRKWQIPIMILNDSMVREARASDFPPEQLTWMPNPVEIDAFCPVSRQASAAWRNEHGIPADARVVIYTGRLSPEKGIRELMNGVAEAARSNSAAMLMLVGDGPQRGELEALARQLDPHGSRFLFTGRVPLAEIPKWLGAADAFALTSPNEGFSCSLVEAMAVGIPCVVSDIEANLQLVQNQVHGLTVPWNQPAAIAAALLRLFADDSLRRLMGSAARTRVVQNYSTEKVVARYQALFDRALSVSAKLRT